MKLEDTYLPKIIAVIILCAGAVIVMPARMLFSSVLYVYAFVLISTLILGLTIAVAHSKGDEIVHLLLTLILFAFAIAFVRGLIMLASNGVTLQSAVFITYGAVITALSIYFLYRRYYGVHHERRI